MTSYSSIEVPFEKAKRKFFFREQSSDEEVITQVFVKQEYDLGLIGRSTELSAFTEQLKVTGRAPLIVDGGANIGASSVYFANRFPEAHIVAIEPHPRNFELLCKNVDGLRVEPIHAALSSATNHRVRMVDPGRGHWAYRTVPIKDESPDGIVCVTLNDLYASHLSSCYPLFVKVDIEGGEVELFSANTEWVALTPLLMVELHDWLLHKTGSSRPFLQCVSKLDRDFVYVGELAYSIANDFHGLLSTWSTPAPSGSSNESPRSDWRTKLRHLLPPVIKRPVRYVISMFSGTVS